MTIAIRVNPDGTAEAIYTEEMDLGAMGKADNVRRASHVEPTGCGQWTADMAPVNGPVLGPFRLRSEALAAETEWLKTHHIGRNQD